MFATWKKCYDKPRQNIQKRRYTLLTEVHIVKAVVFPVVLWELNHKESWVSKNKYFWTVVLKKTLESPLNCKEIKPVNPKGNQSWIFIGMTDAKDEAPILWPPDAKNWLTGKDPDAGKDWRQEEKGMTEDEKVGWHRRLNGYEFEQAPGVGDGQGGLACCCPWGRHDWVTEQQQEQQWSLADWLGDPRAALEPMFSMSALKAPRGPRLAMSLLQISTFLC